MSLVLLNKGAGERGKNAGERDRETYLKNGDGFVQNGAGKGIKKPPGVCLTAKFYRRTVKREDQTNILDTRVAEASNCCSVMWV